MKRVLMATCIATACAVGLAAQSQTPTSQDPTSQSSQRMAKGSVTVTGCVRAGEDPNSFVLANPQFDKSKSESPTSAYPSNPSSTSPSSQSMPGTAGTTGSSNSIKLSASSDIDLQSHVGHKVQVTGTLVPSSDRTAGTTGTKPSSTSPENPTSSSSSTSMSSQSSANARSLTVTSIKMLSDTCEAK